MLPIIIILLVTTTTASPQLKLALHTTRFSSLSSALAFDSLRLSSLYSSASNSTAALSAPIVSGAASGAGQYYVVLHVGTPPQPVRLVADTGSDLVWTRCSPCRDGGSPVCRRRHPPGSAFLPRLSASFSPLHCFNPACRLLPRPPSSPPCSRTPLHSPCRYRYSYTDRSSSAGFFSEESATVAAAVLRLRFGCAFNVSAGSSLRGVLGLGRGPVSFPSQATGRLPRAADRFSYCLMDYTLSPPPTSYLLVGGREHDLPDLRFTPLVSNPLSPTFYYVDILGANVDGEEVRIDPIVWAIDRATGDGGTIVDSGTTLSFVPAPAYRRIVRSMRRQIPRAAVVPGPEGFDLCVNASGSWDGMRMPRLGFRLLGGAEFSPPPGNYFVDAAEGVRCLALQAVTPAGGGGFGVIGNLLQQGFLFVFDRGGDRIGFSRTGCGPE